MSKQVRLTLPDDLYKTLKEQGWQDHSQLHITFIKKPITYAHILSTGCQRCSTHYTKSWEPIPGDQS